LTLLLDRASAKRAEGTSIDFVDTPQGPAFKIENPNEPARVRPLMPTELKAKVDAGDAFEQFDVRTEQERNIARIEGARLLDKEAQQFIMSLPKATVLVFHCHHGSRSQQAAEFFCSHGFGKVYNLEGGIDAWSEEIDSNVPRY
jgi:monothiol glutaredoxin